MKGCVTVRDADWDEIIFLLFGDVAFVVFSVGRKYLSALGGYF